MVHGTMHRAGSGRQMHRRLPSSAVQQAYREASDWEDYEARWVGPSERPWGGGITNVTGGQGAKTDDGRQGDDAVADNRSITGAPHGAGGLADWGTQHELWTGVAWLVVIPSGFCRRRKRP